MSRSVRNCRLVKRRSEGTRGTSDSASDSGSMRPPRSSSPALGSLRASSWSGGGSATVARQFGHVGGSTWSTHLGNPPVEAVVMVPVTTRQTGDVLAHGERRLADAAVPRLETVEHLHCKAACFGGDDGHAGGVYSQLRGVQGGDQNSRTVLKTQVRRKVVHRAKQRCAGRAEFGCLSQTEIN